MKSLTRPVTSIQSHYHTVVIGSGYGGSVAASRISRANPDQRLCLLERGKEMLPGSFPDSISSAAPEFQVSFSDHHVGSSTGLFDLRINDDLNVMVGCGLGGTSLINASVSLKAERWVMEDNTWPQVLRDESATADSLLQLGYQRAEAMLKPAVHPHPERLKKYLAHQKSAESLDGEFYATPINVNFVATESNHVGVPQLACDNCGDCVSGCNLGAKNTTTMNYLPDAVNHGAEIFCEMKVSHIERSGEQWRVYYQPQSLHRDAFDAPAMFVLADRVVLAAGAMGSTEILMRSREHGLPFSDQLGQGFSGNGDVLAFAYNCDVPINGIGCAGKNMSGRDPVGPCITSVIDDRELTGDQGMVIEEGCLPGAIAPLLSSMFSAASAVIGDDTDSGFIDEAGEKFRAAESFFRGAYHGAVHHTQTFLVMSHDDFGGELTLEDDRLCVHWPNVGTQPIFNTISDRLRDATAALGGTYIHNPIWNKWMGHDLITVHPLGGCSMAGNAEQGVVNDRCQVFSSNQGTEVYNNLYVCDGAIIPRSLGVNPLLTISALSERACMLMAAEQGIDENYSETSQASGETLELKPGIQFTETMRGHMSLSAGLDYAAAEADGEQQGHSFAFTLTVISDDIETMLTNPEHRASMLGTVVAPALSDKPLMAVQGEFQLFVRAADAVGTRRMEYRMPLIDESGRRYFFHGYKDVDDDRGLDMWPDTTTLYISLYDGESDQSPLLGRGILHIEPKDFARQMTTMKARNTDGKIASLKTLAKFGRFFAGSLAKTYGGPLAPFELHDPDEQREVRPLRVGEPEYHTVTTDDGVELLLTRYNPPTSESNSSIMLAHGLGVSSKIFSLDTIETNLLEYLYAAGYDVWLLDFRASIDLPASTHRFSGDDIARYDFPAAVSKLLTVTGEDSTQVVAHCFGGCTFTLAMMSGLKGVRSAVISQVASHYKGNLLARLKTGLYIPTVLEKLGVESLTAYRDSHADWLEQLYDNALRLYPQEFEERTNSAVDKRIAFMYGQLWELDQLNQATHDILHELFGVANIESFQHLAMMMRHGHAVDKAGNDVYLPQAHNMKIPIRFIHGAENATFLPEGAEQAVEFLSEANGARYYDMKKIPNYGHLDCIFGRNAVDDVYPLIKEHLDEYA